ncbi:isoquinoline 1-oxidoreductase subunit beta [Marmoricola endophyticus]|uniref:Isoquinoline 1-oxidoreductase subunit beta n=1 Tax=Marmoricola endophyticus TaxID=2040280 RepID=A0A917BJS9_9ACTN|nr:molybdopterin cofactor-binding domain-containing protein [Marmoricola endophyticus]GGF44303.1 isoquinoline 1-oxidoreductase subunit beta [Marmoricola endophyticus]
MTTDQHRTPTDGVEFEDEQEAVDAAPGGLGRRHFVGYVVAGSTLAVAADLTTGAMPADAATPAAGSGTPIPSAPQIAEAYDLEDLQTQAALPTSQLITIEVDKDGVAHFALPRMEVGQGITTSTAMIIAEELDLPLSKVQVSLAPARPELLFNQLTGGSNTTVSTYTPVRVAAALAKKRLLDAAAILLGGQVALLKSKEGIISLPGGGSVTYGEAAAKAASPSTEKVDVTLKKPSEHKVIGTPRNRVDALDAVTGKKQFSMDLAVKDALPTMICRPPTVNGKPKSIKNRAAVLAMPGVTHVATLPTGVAVRARTFGQCIDAVRALQVVWNRGTVEGMDDEAVLKQLRAAQLPLAVPKVPILAKTVEASFEFMFRSGAALEPNCAVADYKDGKITVWAGLKSPLVAQANIADALGIPQTNVTVNVITGGGSFGHKLFSDGAIEAARAAKAFGKPVKLMWHRCDEPRQGRSHPMSTSRIRATVLGNSILTFEQRHTGVSTDFRHGLGERLTNLAADLPTGLGNLGFSESIFLLTQELGYNMGVVTQLLTETKNQEQFPTSSVRNIYSPDVRTASELMMGKLAEALKMDPVEFRLRFLKEERTKAVLRKVAEVANWGKTMPKGTAQGVAIHKEYKGATATIVELDCRPETVNRKIRDAVTGPRVMRATIVVDAGLVINPRGLEAQMMGGVSDGIAQALTSSSHLRNGSFLEGSWDNFFYTRQWNAPLDFQCVVMKSDSEQPGGAGEAGVASSMAATAAAYWKATGTMPTRFPILHDQTPDAFEVKPFSPPIPESPTDGLQYTY